MAGKGKTRREPTRIRLTLMGWSMIAAGAMVGVAAAKSHAPFLFILTGAMLGSAALSIGLSVFMLSPIRLQRNLPDRIWQNQAVHVSYYLRNGRKRGSCLAIEIEEVRSGSIESVGGFCANLPPGASFHAAGRFIPSRRGRLQLPGLQIQTEFPFGLVRTSRRIYHHDEVIVWPARGRLLKSILNTGASLSSRTAPSEIKGGQDEFFGLREYRSGDDPRWIAWRRSVNRKLVVREMSRPRPQRLTLLLDTQEDHYHQAEQFESQLRFAATLIDHALARGFEVSLAQAGPRGPEIYPPGGGIGQLRALLDALALADFTGPESWRRLLGASQRRQLRGTHCIALPGPVAGGPTRPRPGVSADDLPALFAENRLPPSDAEAA